MVSVSYVFQFINLIVQKCLQLVKWNKKAKKKNQQNRQKGRIGMERETEDFSYTSQGCV